MKLKLSFLFFLLLVFLSPFLSFSSEEGPCEIGPILDPAPSWAKIYVNGYRYAEGDRSQIQLYGRTQAFRPADACVSVSVEGKEAVNYPILVTRRHGFETGFIRIAEKNTKIEIFFQAWDGSWFSTIGFADTEKNGFCGFDETWRVDYKN